MKRNACKVGISKNSIEKYVRKLDEIGCVYIVLDFNKEMRTLTSIYSKEGDYKTSMYKMLENILYISKINDKKQCLEIVNKIDEELNTQRIFLRIMSKNKWIDNKKFNIVIKKYMKWKNNK